MIEKSTTIAVRCDMCSEYQETVVNHRHRDVEEAEEQFKADLEEQGWQITEGQKHLCRECNPDAGLEV